MRRISTILRHRLLLLLVVLPVSGRVNPRQRLDRRVAARSSSSSSLVSRSSSSRRRPVSPTTAQGLRRDHVPVVMFLGYPFRNRLLLFLLDAQDAIESLHPRRLTQPAEWSSLTTPTSLHARTHRANKSSRKPFLISRIQSAGTHEILINHWSPLQPPTRIHRPITSKGAWPRRKRLCHSPIQRKATFPIVVLDLMYQLSNAS